MHLWVRPEDQVALKVALLLPAHMAGESCHALPCGLGPAPVCLAQRPEGSGAQPGCLSLIHSEGPVGLAVALGRPAGLRGAITARTHQVSAPFWVSCLSHLLPSFSVVSACVSLFHAPPPPTIFLLLCLSFSLYLW